VYAGEAPAVGVSPLRRQHALLHQRHDEVGTHRTGAAQLDEGQSGLLFKNGGNRLGKMTGGAHGSGSGAGGKGLELLGHAGIEGTARIVISGW
jgi:hypothetical protein